MASKIFNIIRNSRVYQCSRHYHNVRARPFSSAPPGAPPPSGSPTAEITSIPLSQQVPWIPSPRYASPSDHKGTTQVTTLENGLTVASEEKYGNFCTVGVLIDSGSRYEVNYPSGITHFLEKLSFQSNSMYDSQDEILQKLEKHGGICDCQGSRDTLIYAASAKTSGLSEVVQLMSQVVLRPQITEKELEDARMSIGFELEALNMSPDPEPLLVELIHAASYSKNTLGLPKIAPAESLPLVTRDVLYSYLRHHHAPSRMVLAGVGMPHDELVAAADQHFLSTRPVWEEGAGLVDRGRDQSVAQYTGGVMQLEKDLSNVSLGPTPMPELAHVVIGLESCSHRDPDFITSCVLNMMMGGGGSFSAGGPGKGMYTRLYLNVLNRHHWMHNATAYNHTYSDSGVFCIHASAHPSMIKDAVEVITRELVLTQHGVGEVELSRAKTQVQSMLLMNLESRPVMFEDIGRQVLANGERLAAQHYYDQIAAVTEADITRVARRMLGSVASVACLGDVSHMPSYDNIQSALTSKDGRLPKKFSLFR